MNDPCPRFWMVWSPQGRASTFKHPSRQAADNEAARLARVVHGSQFFVLKAVGGVQSAPPVPEPIAIVRRDDFDDGIPF